MANYIENFNGKLDWAMPFQRTGKFPLDRSCMFSSYDDAVLYASGGADTRGLGGTSYVGQLIVVFENDVVTVYKINADRTIEALTSESGVNADILDLQNQLNAEIAARKEAIDALDSTVTSSTTNVGVTVVQTNGKLSSVTLTQNDIASATNLNNEITARKAVDGQTGQTYTANSTYKHISAATSLNDADIKLNDAITAETKARQDAIDAMDARYAQTISVDSNGKATTNHIGFDLSQLDGKITGFSITEKDIASAYDLSQEIAARKAVDGQSGSVYSSNTNHKHISAATSLNNADVLLNDAITAETANRGTAITNAINSLSGTTSGNGTHVDVTVVQSAGKISSVTIAENDIASASALTAEITARKAIEGQNSTAYTKNTNATYISGATSLNNADVLLNNAIANLKLTAATASEVSSLGTNVKEAYKLVDGNQTQHGEYIKIYKDSSLKSVSLSGQTLVFTYILTDGSDNVVNVDLSSYLTESEYGDGLKVNNHIISTKLGEDTETNKNFLDLEGSVVGQKSLAVRSMDTDVTYTTDRIIIAGGPLDSTNLRNILPKDDSGNAYIEKGTDIQSLLLSLFTKIEWPTPSVTEGKISTSIAAPSFTLTNSGSDVEVGTDLTLSEATLSTATNSTTARTCGQFTYGYSTSANTLTNKGTKTVSISASNIGFNSDNYTMTRTFTGFTNATSNATPSTTASSVKITSAICRVIEGTNSVKVEVTGPKGVCTFAAMPQYYIASNIYSLSADKMSPSKAQATITATTAPSNSKTLTVTGKYKYFMGYSTNTLYSQFNSASVRALTTKSGWITKDGTTTIVDNSGNNNLKSNGTSIVIACPSKYKLASIANGVGANILSNFTSIGEVDVTTGAITTKYKVYVYPITNGAQVEFKNVTLTKA